MATKVWKKVKRVWLIVLRMTCNIFMLYMTMLNLVIQEGLSSFPPLMTLIINRICAHFSRSSQSRYKLRKIQQQQKDPFRNSEVVFETLHWSHFRLGYWFKRILWQIRYWCSKGIAQRWRCLLTHILSFSRVIIWAPMKSSRPLKNHLLSLESL